MPRDAAWPRRHAEEICAAIRFLLDTPSVTGQMIALDGGQHLAWRTEHASGPCKPAALRPKLHQGA